MPAPHATSSAAPAAPDDGEHAAFRDVHAAAIHGFALLLLLGDRPRAGMLAEAALHDARRHREELRHPERAAAWLRRHVVRHAGRRTAALDFDARLAVLHELGVTAPVLAGLGALDPRERATLVADAIERIADADVGTIVGRTGSRLAALRARARRRYLAAAAESVDPNATVVHDPDAPGPTRARVMAIAAQVLP